MAFDAILGQASAIARLKQLLAGGRVPSALLFLGQHNVGKRTTALTLAKALNCRSGSGDSCDQCPSCRKIDEGVHPDVEVVEPDGQFIKIDQIRAVGEKLAMIPLEARKRVVILSRAEQMNPQSANAFLKTLEEPPGDTLIILCALSASQLPETIVSRCLPLRFGMLNTEILHAVIGTGKALNEEEKEFAVRYAQGRLRPELEGSAAGWMVLRDEVLHQMENLTPAAYGDISEKFAKWSSGEEWRFLLEWLETWFRDLSLLGSGGNPARLINADRMEALSQWSRRFPPERADLCYRKVLETRRGIAHNVNRALALDRLWIAFKETALHGGRA